MRKIDYSEMSDEELKQYLLKHRDDKNAFHVYLDRRHTRSRQAIISKGELDHLSVEAQVKLVSERLQTRFGGYK